MFPIVVLCIVVFLITAMAAIHRKPPPPPPPLNTDDRHHTLCIYAYYEKNREYRENFLYFLKHGVHEGMTYIIVVNGRCANLPHVRNVHFLYRSNTGFDFGAFEYALDHIDTSLFKYFVFLNTSVRGPFSNHTQWEKPFLDLLVGDVHLVGTTIAFLSQGDSDTLHDRIKRRDKISMIYSYHIQSMVFAMDYECLEYLRPVIFSNTRKLKTMTHAILDKEILMSTMVLQHGWNISCLASKYRGYDYRKVTSEMNPTSDGGNPCVIGGYFGQTLQAHEVVFIKSHLLPTDCQVVVARYNEDTKWLQSELFHGMSILCYNKGPRIPDHCIAPQCRLIPLENVGRCDHTYLYHIVHHYDNLAPVTIFLPGSCMSKHKIGLTRDVVNNARETKDTVLIGTRYKDVRTDLYSFTINMYGSTNPENNKENPETQLLLSPIRPFGKWFDKHFGPDTKAQIVCYYGIFAASRRDIQQHPKSFYEELLAYVDTHSNPEVGHYLERSWGAMFKKRSL